MGLAAARMAPQAAMNAEVFIVRVLSCRDDQHVFLHVLWEAFMGGWLGVTRPMAHGTRARWCSEENLHATCCPWAECLQVTW